MKYVIPADFSCQKCTLQWYYATANSCLPDNSYRNFGGCEPCCRACSRDRSRSEDILQGTPELGLELCQSATESLRLSVARGPCGRAEAGVHGLLRAGRPVMPPAVAPKGEEASARSSGIVPTSHLGVKQPARPSDSLRHGSYFACKLQR